MTPFARDGICESCGCEYTVSGVSLAPGTETEAPARFRCACGGWLSAFIPGSVNKERLVFEPKGAPEPS
ncbi:MAG: hypothetical protein LJF30_14185 [Acidobacteria bacterium]|jgi:hypothetical protein|nr:hypothetical protein [Acidobacteriota bacterium]